MPGIAGLTRFEHVLGVAHLARVTAYGQRISQQERTCLVAAALLHDWAISAFGHLVEEGFASPYIVSKNERPLLGI